MLSFLLQCISLLTNTFCRLQDLHNSDSRWWTAEQKQDSMTAISQCRNRSQVACWQQLILHRKSRKRTDHRQSSILQPPRICLADRLRDIYHHLLGKLLSLKLGFLMKIEITQILQQLGMQWAMVLWTQIKPSSVGPSIANWRWETLSLSCFQLMSMVKVQTALAIKSQAKTSITTQQEMILAVQFKKLIGHTRTRKMTWKTSTRLCSEYKTCVGLLND